jgi:hypothetical protein
MNSAYLAACFPFTIRFKTKNDVKNKLVKAIRNDPSMDDFADFENFEESSQMIIARGLNNSIQFDRVYGECIFRAKTLNDLEKSVHHYKNFLILKQPHTETVRIRSVLNKDPQSWTSFSSLRSNVIPELYPTLDIGLLAKSFYESDESILILTGPPGVGKTHFAKYFLYQDVKGYERYYIRGDFVQEDSFWQAMTDGHNKIMVFDDLDAELGDRTPFVSGLLAYSNGVVQNKSKLIITTNQQVDNIDEAVLRPGRCFDVLALEPLTYRQAYRLWTEFFENRHETFVDYFGDTECNISQAHLMSCNSMYNANTDRSYNKTGSTQYSVSEKIKKLGIDSKGQRKVI